MEDNIDQSVLPEVAHAIRESAHTREHDLRSAQDGLRVPRDDRFAADPLETLLNAPEISHSVVDYRYHKTNRGDADFG